MARLRALVVGVGVGVGVVLSACSGEYPLPPTRCDEWCDATKGGGCLESYDPAGCVSSCEAAWAESRLPIDRCAAEIDAVITCYRSDPTQVARNCDFTAEKRCTREVEALGVCNDSIGRGGPVDRR